MDSGRNHTLHALPQELIEAACQRDPEAWEEMVEQLSLILVRRLRLPIELARRLDDEDILQVAFLRAWERIESFEYRGEGSFIAWIQQILLNVLRDDIRHHGRGIRDTACEERRQLAQITPERPNPDQQAALQEESLRLVAAIEALPVLEQRLIRLRLRDGRSWREIAARTGHSQRTLRRALDDAMRNLAIAVA
jgi:RNA polymerase sigma-70 factor (ECF subfamily)